MRAMPTYSLKELAKLAGVTPRTVRFYIEQGLLPSPGTSGPGTRYTDAHLGLLRTIKKLQLIHFPLAEIRNRLRTLTTDQMAEIQDAPTTNQAADSAVEYIRRVMSRPPVTPPAASAPATPAQAAAAPPAPSAVAHVPARTMAAPSRIAPMEPTDLEPRPGRSQWERIPLDADVEIHIRRPLTRHQNKRVERLITIARQLFEED